MNFVVQNWTELWDFSLGLLQLHSATWSTLMSLFFEEYGFCCNFQILHVSECFTGRELYRSLNIHDLSYIIDS